LVIGSDVAYRDRMLPGVRVGGIDIGNMQRGSAETLLVQHQAALSNKPIQLRTAQRTWQVTAGTLLDRNTTAGSKAAFAYGHEPSFARRALTRLRAFAGHDHLIDTTQANVNEIRELVGTITAEVTREQRDAQLLHTASGWQVLPEQTGTQVNQEQARAALATLVDEAEQQPTLSVDIPLIRTEPEITTVQLEPARQKLDALTQRPLSLQLGDRQWTLDRSMLMQIGNNEGTATVTSSRHLIEQQLDQIAGEVAITPQQSQLVRDGNRVRSITPGQPGRELDREAAVDAVAAALSTGAESISLPVRELPTPPGEAEQLGLIAELGRGVSQFKTYSTVERDANVQAGGYEVDGVLVAPGEIFSFTGTIRDITWEEGYRWGEMIEAGVVVPSLGGGICQVSTTVFRAAFWSGLEIVERHNHTWRLAWYEVDAPPGMDATIALGGPDLKFRNNTGHHLLLKVETDLERKQQTVIIYGTPDGRHVTMDAVAGGNIGVQRSVIKPDGAVANETYLSYYTQ
jgi:vancomycin resistance protein YoaR